MAGRREGETRIDTGTFVTGMIVRAESGFYRVPTANGDVLCTLRGRLKDTLYEEVDDGSRRRRYADPGAVGDQVQVTILGDEGVVEEVLPRRSKLSRIMAKANDGAPDVEQVIVANVDRVVVVASVKRPRLNLRFIDRLLLLAEFGGASSLLCLNKSDLLREKERTELDTLLERVYRPLGVQWHLVSAIDGEGIAELREALVGELAVFVGSSGTGKSTILNSLEPSLNLRTGDVSKSSRKGRHTTTNVELFETENGLRIADTPGLREVGLWGVPKESIDFYFVEMRPYLGQCQFGDCWHIEEPDCAVRAAVASGKISRERYESYRKLCREVPSEEHERPGHVRRR